MDYSDEAIRRLVEVYKDMLGILETEVVRIKQQLFEWECYSVQSQEGESISYADYAEKDRDI